MCAECDATPLWDFVSNLQASKFHACATLPHEVFDEISLPVIHNKSYVYSDDAAKFTAIYTKILNIQETKELVYQCERTDIHEHSK